MNNRELDDLVERLKQTACGGTHWNEMLLSASHAICVLRQESNQLCDQLAAARAELAAEEQRVADMMADVNRVGHANDALRQDLAAAQALLRDCRSLVRCESLDHYRKADQHDGFGPCPIEMRMKDAIDAALAEEKK